MTYNNTLQGRFVTAGYPVVAMLFVSLLLWIVGYLFSLGSSSAILETLGLNFIGDAFARIFSLLSYVCVALLLTHIYLFERRLPFLMPLFMWLASVQFLLHADYLIALSLLFFLLAVAQLLSCSQNKGQERGIYAAFAILSFSSLFLFQFTYIIPLFFIYLWIADIFNLKNLFAAILGVVTPYWLLFGTLYVIPSLGEILIPLKYGVLNMLSPATLDLSPHEWITLAVEFIVWGVALFTFFASSLPAKQLLRRRLLFIFIVNIYLQIVSFVLPQDYMLLLAWRLPGLAIMSAYVFSMKVTRLSNIYFIAINTVWLAIAALCLWNGL